MASGAVSPTAFTARPPVPSQLAHLKPRNSAGFLFVTSCVGLTGLAIFLSALGFPATWLAGQILLALALLQWFVLLHEAGHYTLFRTKRLNKYVGHLAAFFAVIPFECWKLVHDRHHVWTGWQDLDATTASLVPRHLGRGEKALVNVCWKFWLPLFSVFYRFNNFWNISRLGGLFPPQQLRRMRWNVVLLLTTYAGVVSLIGFDKLLHVAGLGLLLCLIFQDPLLLSQHTHILQNISRGEKVQPFPPLQQEVFTRSLRFPSWFSTCVLLNLDAHELHHMYVHVPGYDLRRINYVPRNEVHWWLWLAMAKQIPGDVFLFQNRTQSGFNL